MAHYDFVPRSGSKFHIWQDDLISLIETNAKTWGIPAASLAAIKTVQSVWTKAFVKASNKQNRTAADVREKDDARKIYEKELRKFIAQWLGSNSEVTDTDRERMNIRVKLGTRAPVPVPLSSPNGWVDFSVREQHIIHIIDDVTMGKAKPHGVHGCEIWMKPGGEPPKADSDFSYQGISTKSLHTVIFSGYDVGKTIYYRLRWINKRGKPGPWSNTFSAVVGG